MNQILYKPKNGIHYALRRLPTEINGWPEKQRILLPVPLDLEQRRQYNLAWTEFKAHIQGETVKNKQSAEKGMAATIRFLQKASLLRVNHTVEQITDLLDNGYQVAVSCKWRDSLAAIEEGLKKHKYINISSIHGETKNKEAERIAFQTGKTQVMLFTVVEGINLQEGEILEKDRPRAQIDHDLRWTGIEIQQIDGRCHRDGKFAKIYWMCGENTKEVNLAERMLSKVKSMNTLSGDKNDSIEDLINILT
jgi:SNF2 family DNA or RNA helicase